MVRGWKHEDHLATAAKLFTLANELASCVDVVLAQQRQLIEAIDRQGYDTRATTAALETLKQALDGYLEERRQLLNDYTRCSPSPVFVWD